MIGSTKPRIAIWTPGGIGGGDFNQGLPILMNIVGGLSAKFEITVFSFATVTESGVAGVKVISPPRWLIGSILRWTYLFIFFMFSHFTGKFKLIYSFWGYPTGTIVVALGKLFAVPSIVTVLGGELASLPKLQYGHLRKSRTKKIVQWTCREANALTVISGYQSTILKSIGVGRDVKYIPFGTDERYFEMKKKTFPQGELKILHVSNLTPVKDQETLLNAFAIIIRSQSAILRIVGPDQMNGRLQTLAAQLGLNQHVEFVGSVPHGELPPYYEWADIFLLTSLSEGQNNSLTDAAYSGLLLVSTPVGAAFDIGLAGVVIVPFGDAQTIAHEIVSISKNPDRWQKLTTVSSQWAINHNLKWSIDKLSTVFLEVINNTNE